MATWPYGKAPAADGTGTTPLNMQRIIGANWHTSGIKPTGGVTVEGTSSMAYRVEPGAVVLKTAAGLGLEYAIEGQTVNTPPAPSTGSRLDRVYMDRDGNIGVTHGDAPGGGITLGVFNVPAGITATTDAAQSVDRNFAIPAGASLGRLYAFHDPADGVKGNPDTMRLGNGRFYLPSDRLVRFDLTHCLSAVQNTPQDQPSATIRWRVYVDDEAAMGFTTRVTRAVPQVNFMSFTLDLGEGSHRVHYLQDQVEGLSGPGWRHHKGGGDAWPGNRFEVWDAGAAR